jgi:serine/threonine protein kinase
MKAGDNIRGYTLTTDLKTAGGGQCIWGFAEKDGKEFFIKQFLAPKYPVAGAPGSESTKERKRKSCEEFESRHIELWRALEPVGGGNLIVTHEFFREGPEYFKVTDKVDAVALTTHQIAALDRHQKFILLRSIINSVQRLHNIGVVHGDLKPANILTFKTESGNYSAKVIDFDNAYKAGIPAHSVEGLVGDMGYYSPEMYRAVTMDGSDRGVVLSYSADIFALGIVFTQYLTGERPGVDATVSPTIAKAVIDGQRVSIGRTNMPSHIDSLIFSMLALEPWKRPTANQLMDLFTLESKRDFAPTAPIHLDRLEPIAATESVSDSGTKPVSRLQGSLIDRRLRRLE